MAWLSITLELDAPQAEALSEALIEAGAQSVALDPAGGGPRTRLTVLAAADADPARLVAAAARASALAAPEFRVARLDDEDWVRRSQAQFGPLQVSDALWIVPSWHALPAAAAAATVVRLDPGLAFGTGSHASTRLVLKFLERSVRAGDRVLDYGCGSGILAIVAAKLGAGEIAAVDIDPQALEAAALNARQNGVALQVSAPDALAPGAYDLIVANILAGPLVALAPLLTGSVRTGGKIALAGILEEQADAVCAAYARDFEIGVGALEEGWALVEGTRR